MADKKGVKMYVIYAIGKNDKPYYALVADLSYTRKYICFGAMNCAELMGIYPSELPSFVSLDHPYLLCEY